MSVNIQHLVIKVLNFRFGFGAKESTAVYLFFSFSFSRNTKRELCKDQKPKRDKKKNPSQKFLIP